MELLPPGYAAAEAVAVAASDARRDTIVWRRLVCRASRRDGLPTRVNDFRHRRRARPIPKPPSPRASCRSWPDAAHYLGRAPGRG